jgi:ketosteroid isomerase-like protein
MPKTRLSTPAEVEAAFYRALERGDLAAMMSLWAEEEPVACVHPAGLPIEGYGAVEQSWRRVLGSGARLRFQTENVRRLVARDLAVHLLDEVITVVDDERRRQVRVFTTNVYRRTPDGWRMVLHQASTAQRQEVAEDEPAPVVH